MFFSQHHHAKASILSDFCTSHPSNYLSHVIIILFTTPPHLRQVSSQIDYPIITSFVDRRLHIELNALAVVKLPNK
ncbi:hypothetical protein OWV82_005502 [Melia azedarach]|uniref:Uncharacterized protein n=1 Tax=Melia azedarach TaxID=155640 RepID=A0ACC1YEG9_MELAZ|nr:hypothetical protein OWV82_005502 [Melia azedarach]